MRKLIHPFTFLILGSLATPALAADNTPPKGELDKTLIKLSELIGGTWANDNPKFKVEFRYYWAFNRSAVRSIGTIDKGGANETPVEVTFGWDPAKKEVYYIDFHGGDRVYKGTVKLEGDEIHLDFETLIGPPAKWRSVGKLADQDTYQFTIFGQKDGNWTPVVTQTLKRRKS